MQIELNKSKVEVISNYTLKENEILYKGVKYNMDEVAVVISRIKGRKPNEENS